MDKVSYALGMSVANNLMGSGVKSLDVDEFVNGLKDMLGEGETKMTANDVNAVLSGYFTELKRQEVEAATKSGKQYLEENAKKEGVTVTASGLQYQVLVEGTGKKPGKHGQVECHYEGRLIDGTKFDSSYDRGQTAKFGLDQVIRGWTEGLQLMSEGSKYEFVIPAELGYGETGVPGAIPGNAVLVFTVELVKVL